MINIEINAKEKVVLQTGTLLLSDEMFPVNIKVTDSDPGEINVFFENNSDSEENFKVEDSEKGIKISFVGSKSGGGTIHPLLIGYSEGYNIYLMFLVQKQAKDVYKIEYSLYGERR